MFWATVIRLHHSPLVPIPSGVSQNSHSYMVNVLEPHLWPFYERITEQYGDIVVMEDNTPGHNKYTIDWRIKNDLPVLAWPPNSADLIG